ncbi:hypothetical protein [Leifsonia sp. Leaf264]|uniref:hypothetical protein n=1 Tax=Leifsonia sp. Leaf264 TaxID=1736314 RepID=UPI00070219FE|nr:hypothetical protein [Leifsonia sp. Leaf264]KQO98356.1 hypothetical protein ASF30_09865 [Leifsonia sp. Leaf264]
MTANWPRDQRLLTELTVDRLREITGTRETFEFSHYSEPSSHWAELEPDTVIEQDNGTLIATFTARQVVSTERTARVTKYSYGVEDAGYSKTATVSRFHVEATHYGGSDYYTTESTVKFVIAYDHTNDKWYVLLSNKEPIRRPRSR